MKVAIDSEKILAAAINDTEEVAKALKALFPKVFNNPYLNLELLIKKSGNFPEAIFSRQALERAGIEGELIEIRTGGNFADKAFYLDDTYNWKITKDNNGITVLVPSKKNKK